ncbi:MAG: HAMP domain-containing histidine kinase [Parasporobacterium sp.]|nr:HAMP domain-containing histidine kinase [Parasporobacterium sp.]
MDFHIKDRPGKKEDFRKTARHRGSILRDTVISAASAILAEAALIILLNTPVLDSILRLAGYSGSFVNLISSHFPEVLTICLFIEVLVYSVVFSLLRRREIRYLQQISTALQDVSEGNFYRSLPVLGDDELSDIALQLNHMTGEIRILMDREKEAEQTKNDLITNVAHDLRTPLTSIIGYLDLLLRNETLTEGERLDYVRVAYTKAKHLQVLIEELFGFTKLNYTQTQAFAPLDIVRLLAQLLDEFFAVFEQNDIQCEYHPDREQAIVMGDGVLLARLFDNLLGNAVKYGREGKLIKVSTKTDDDLISISVVNFGKVIESKDLEHIFDKFYRADQSRSPATGGTGLGLAIAKSIAEAHGGTIKADSSLSGTVFEVVLPLYAPEDGSGAAAE